MASGGASPQDAIGPYDAADLEAALRLPCRVTGCEPEALAAIYRAGLPAMDDDDLADAAGLARDIARTSAAILHDATEADPQTHARLVAQAAADAAVARLYAAEIARRRARSAT